MGFWTRPNFPRTRLPVCKSAPSSLRRTIRRISKALNGCSNHPSAFSFERNLKLLVEKGLAREIGTGPTDPTEDYEPLL